MKTVMRWFVFAGLVYAGLCAAGATTDVEYVEYTELAYGAYFDTGVVPNDHQLEVHFRENATASGAYIFGVSQSGNDYRFRSSGELWYWAVNGTERSAPYWSFGDHVLIFNDTVDHNVTLDGLVFGSASGTASTGRLYLGRDYNTRNFAGRIYAFKLTTSAGVPVFDWRPATLNGQAGFHDRVSDTFISPAAGTVTAGPALHGGLTVTGAPPVPVAGLDPVYGITNNIASNATFTVSAPTVCQIAPELRYTCAGWKLYTLKRHPYSTRLLHILVHLRSFAAPLSRFSRFSRLKQQHPFA